ncbi:MAG: MBL fold metallo-hydrolase [Candidatus Falkowbacteria bacterium]
MIKLSFHGACREVTGSCSLLQFANFKILVDCGVFQGEHFAAEHNERQFDFNPASIQYVFLTHAHMDHCGRLPKLYHDGFRGRIYSTEATRDLVEIMLIDAAKIIAREALAYGHQPLYGIDDVRGLMGLFDTIPYNEFFHVENSFKVKPRDAGHILGSAFFEFYIPDEGREKKIVFSGDLGNSPSPIIRDLETTDSADVVIVESTYAGVSHETKEEGIEKLRAAVVETIAMKGTLIIPIFVIEKTQEILFELNSLEENHGMPRVPMFLDSPLAIKAVDIYKNYEELYNENSRHIVKSGDDIFNFPGLKYTSSKSDSIAINHAMKPKVILSSSGMCVGGRVPYHLKMNLADPNSYVLLVAYQSPGTLGRKLLDGDKSVYIYGESIPVKAKIAVINSFSSHADEPHILEWLSKINSPRPRKVFINHGEEANSLNFAGIIGTPETQAIVPEYGQVYEI